MSARHTPDNSPPPAKTPEKTGQDGLVIVNYGKNLLVEDSAGALHRCVARRGLEQLVCGDRVTWSPTGDAEGVVEALHARNTVLQKADGRKRLRPLVTILTTTALGGDPERAVDPACAIEMVHTASLILDDLPCMDDDSLRRGKPTNHKVYGEATAVLAGDALLTDAFYLLSKSIAGSDISPQIGIEIVRDISKSAGSQGMIGGQALDLDLEGKVEISIDKVEQMHSLKTGALLSSAVTSGAMVGGASSHQLESLRRYGNYLGLAYQITDDLLDIEGGDDLGKDRGSDIKKKKVTYPSVAGVERAKENVGQLTKCALRELDSFGNNAIALRSITQYLCERKS